MSDLITHRFYEGTTFHKRFHPKQNKFKYNYYILDIDVDNIDTLENSFLGVNSIKPYSFFTKDHFGASLDFKKNCLELLDKFGIQKFNKLRFLTLPRVFNFVFNPISILVVINENTITHILAEVHNYNGGRVVYPVKLEQSNNSYKGVVTKDMYVSPYFKTTGRYEFELIYDEDRLKVKIDLYEDDVYKLTANMNLTKREFSLKNTQKIFFKYMFTNFLVVLRTYFQALKLFIKGLKIYTPRQIDKVRRY